MQEENNTEFEQLQENEHEESTSEETPQGDVDWKSEALKYKNISERLKKKINEKEVYTPPAPVKESQTPQDFSPEMGKKLERLELLQKGYTEDAVNFLMEHGGTQSLKNPYIQKAVQALDEEKKQQQAIDIENETGSSSSRKYTIDELRKLSSSEMEKVLSQ